MNIILIRYADVLLMNAEALVELGEFSETDWNKTIRPLRVRAGFTDEQALKISRSICRFERNNQTGASL